MTGATLVNFSHPVTDIQQEDIAALLGQPLTRVINVPTHFDHSRSFADQSGALLKQLDISWETTPLVVNLPALSPIAAVILTQLHGLIGHFPAIVRFRPKENSVPTIFEVAEIIALDRLREQTRLGRAL